MQIAARNHLYCVFVDLHIDIEWQIEFAFVISSSQCAFNLNTFIMHWILKAANKITSNARCRMLWPSCCSRVIASASLDLVQMNAFCIFTLIMHMMLIAKCNSTQRNPFSFPLKLPRIYQECELCGQSEFAIFVYWMKLNKKKTTTNQLEFSIYIKSFAILIPTCSNICKLINIRINKSKHRSRLIASWINRSLC